MKTTTILILAISTLCASCTSERGDGPEGTVNTVLEGRLYFGLADRVRAVEVFDFDGGMKGARLCRAESDAAGAWRCELGPLFGSFVVEVGIDRSTPMRAFSAGASLGETRNNVEVTPVTHLVLSYVEYLLSRSVPLDQASEKARRLVFEHFAGLDHARVTPENIYDTRAVTLTDSVVVGALLAGFDELAGRISDQSGMPRNGLVNRFSLLAALHADIRADGVFDGTQDGGPLSIGSVVLDGNTLRAKYARAILEWLDGNENETSFTRADFGAIANAIAANTSEIFPEGSPERIDNVGPMITRVFVSKGGAEISSDAPVSGMVTLEVTAEDPSGVRNVAIEIEGGTDAVGENESRTPGAGRFSIDTTRLLEDGRKVLTIVATDGAGNVARSERPFVSDNTRPVLAASAAGVVSSGQVRVTGTAMDAIGPIAQIEITGGALPVVLAAPPPAFEATVDLACNQPVELRVSAVDAAGNRAFTVTSVRCDDTPPTLVWTSRTFDQEGTLRTTYAPNGSSVTYAFSGAPDRLTFDGATVWPVTIEKYMNRLDDTADNLPTFAFVASDSGFPVGLDYRYLVNSQLIRDWTPLSLGGGSGMEAVLPLSYQTLDARLGRGVEADTHRVEVRATDAAGNEVALSAEFHVRLLSPPVWFGNCQLPSSLSNYSLLGRTLREIYVTRPETLVLQAEVRYVLGLNQSSLAPGARAIVQFQPGPVVSRITRISEDRHDGAVFVPNDYFTEICIPPGHRWINAQGQLGPCQSGLIPPEHVTRTRAADGPFNQETPHLVGLGVLRAGAPVLPLATAEYLIAPEASHSINADIQQPRLFVGGAVYNWSEAFTVPTGYTASSVPGRYRMLAYDRGPGINFDGDILNVDARRFVTRGYISGFEIEVAPVVLTARHETLPELPVGIAVAPSCAAPLVYTTQL